VADPSAAPPRAAVRRLVAAVAWLWLAVVVRTARRTSRTVRDLREAGARVPPLEHTLDLPGRGEPLHLVVLGDSAAAGHGLPSADDGLARRVGRQLAATSGRPVTVRSHAVDGATTADVVGAQVARLPADAEVVLVGVGVNDAVRGRRPTAVRSGTSALLAGVRAAAPRAEVVLLTCPDLGSAPGVPGALRRPLRWSCRRVAAAQRRVAADLGVAVVGADGHLPAEAFGVDGFHPGPVGVATLADRVVAALGAAPDLP
jgi:lysophospholipase L1-like esterase